MGAGFRYWKQEYDKACNGLVVEIANRWCWDVGHYGYWIGDEVGGLFAYGDATFITMADIIYCLEEDIGEGEYTAYTDYNVRCSNCGFTGMNLKAWHKGAPRIPDETFERIESLKREIDELTKETKKKMKEEK